MVSLPSTLALISLALMGAAWWVGTHPHLIARRQDAFGRGMATAFLTLLLLAGSAGCALASAIIASVRWTSLAWTVRALAWAPSAVLLALLVGSYVSHMRNRARRASRFLD